MWLFFHISSNIKIIMWSSRILLLPFASSCWIFFKKSYEGLMYSCKGRQSSISSCQLSFCCNSKRINSPMILCALAGGLGDEASPSPTPSAPPHSGPLTHSASWECLSTLPTNGSPLRHVTHVRPRPPRRHRAAYFPPESVSSWGFS